jgi:hypothetical protein
MSFISNALLILARHRGLRQVDFVFERNEIRGLEQNPDTKSRWTQMARTGKKVMQFLGGGRYIGNVVDGKLTLYSKRDRPLSYCESHKQNPAMVAEMDRLLNDYNYAEVARILNENGFKTGDGLTLTSPTVGYIRTAYGLKSRFDRLRERGMLTAFEIARRCGVSTNTISDWRRKRRIRAHAINDRNQFLFEDPGPTPPKRHGRRVSGNHYSSTSRPVNGEVQYEA